MSIVVTGIPLGLEEPTQLAVERAAALCGRRSCQGEIYKKSVDARRGRVRFVCSVLLEAGEDEAELVRRLNRPDVRLRAPAHRLPSYGRQKLAHRPVVVGLGPAGLFCAYILAQNGYYPVVCERGADMEQRDRDVRRFWRQGMLDPQSNVQFGEGGAGAYSDGKLTTRIHDGRCEMVLSILCDNGAPPEIRQKAKPHIGTDLLKGIVVRMRRAIESWGGQIHFHTRITGIQEASGRLTALETDRGVIACQSAVLALGHSARDTFEALARQGITMQAKPFSVGARIEHEQREIDRALYGSFAGHPALGPAEYTLSWREGGRACYSFCMCPGGQVVAAASEEGGVVVNGMSHHARDGKNANCAIVVSVSPEDFDGSDPLAGMRFQRQIERLAFDATGGWRAPAQSVGEFLHGEKVPWRVCPSYPLGVQACDLHTLLPEPVCRWMQLGLAQFDKKIRGFAAPGAVLTGPETRTSSPVRLLRDERLESVGMRGLIPCGEGAGYAGGIVSAAVEGIRAAEAIIARYRPWSEESIL